MSSTQTRNVTSNGPRNVSSPNISSVNWVRHPSCHLSSVNQVLSESSRNPSSLNRLQNESSLNKERSLLMSPVHQNGGDVFDAPEPCFCLVSAKNIPEISSTRRPRLTPARTRKSCLISSKCIHYKPSNGASSRKSNLTYYRNLNWKNLNSNLTYRNPNRTYRNTKFTFQKQSHTMPSASKPRCLTPEKKPLSVNLSNEPNQQSSSVLLKKSHRVKTSKNPLSLPASFKMHRVVKVYRNQMPLLQPTSSPSKGRQEEGYKNAVLFQPGLKKHREKSSKNPVSLLLLAALLSSTVTSGAALPTTPSGVHKLHDQRQAEYAASLSSYTVVVPLKVTNSGAFISHHLPHHHNHNHNLKQHHNGNNNLNQYINGNKDLQENYSEINNINANKNIDQHYNEVDDIISNDVTDFYHQHHVPDKHHHHHHNSDAYHNIHGNNNGATLLRGNRHPISEHRQQKDGSNKKFTFDTFLGSSNNQQQQQQQQQRLIDQQQQEQDLRQQHKKQHRKQKSETPSKKQTEELKQEEQHLKTSMQHDQQQEQEEILKQNKNSEQQERSDKENKQEEQNSKLNKQHERINKEQTQEHSDHKQREEEERDLQKNQIFSNGVNNKLDSQHEHNNNLSNKPNHTSNPSNQPNHTNNPSNQPNHTSNPSNQPNYTSNPSNQPNHTSNRTNQPNGNNKREKADHKQQQQEKEPKRQKQQRSSSSGGGLKSGHHDTRNRRSVPRDHDASSGQETVHYSITLDGVPHMVSLSPNKGFLRAHTVVERRGYHPHPTNTSRNVLRSSIRVLGSESNCHYTGRVLNHTGSSAAISTCNGLTGFIRTSNDHYIIEPIKGHPRNKDDPHPHLIYKTSAIPKKNTQNPLHSHGDDDRSSKPNTNLSGEPTIHNDDGSDADTTREDDVNDGGPKEPSCGTTEGVRQAWKDREEWESTRFELHDKPTGDSRDDQILYDNVVKHFNGETVNGYKEEEAENSYGNNSRHGHRSKRSVSLERNVEVLVVADQQMVDYYSNEDLNTYILTVMNMVSSVFHDASIGNAINIIVVRIMLLETPQYEEELHISHHADDTLRSFCNWQHLINPRDEHHPHHHDVAVLITRYNICSQMSERCSTLGLAEIAGMCHPMRSCNVNEDTGLQIAYTIAHEMGHNFGMEHDGSSNGCGGEYGHSPHVMSPHLTVDTHPVSWSTCSRREVTNFLDREWGTCLEDSPPAVDYSFPQLPPGAMYDASHQCRLAFGSTATQCKGMQDVCQTLWCKVDARCISRLEPAAEGTQCAKHKWCSGGLCVTMGERPAAIDGNWGSWSVWSPCSRTCGAGIAVASRHCDNPPPEHGGAYCTGDRRKYKVCNTQECPDDAPSIRAVQCSTFDHKPFEGELDPTWSPVMYEATPCELHCTPDHQFYSERLAAAVTDGTPCNPGTSDMCINGLCKRVACDWMIEGTAQEDRCGLCHGDGTQCVTSKGLYSTPVGDGYQEAVQFPEGASNIKIAEEGEGGNYLALMDRKGHWFLNGNLTIQWSGEYSVHGGRLMHYKRDGDHEELFMPGPLKKPLTLMVLFLSRNPGIAWEYTLPHENATYTPSFSWQLADWSVCSVSCGGGSQVAKVQCMEVEAGLVEDKYCEKADKPSDEMRACNLHACPAWWWIGPWQPCSLTCGPGGSRKRTVICVRSFSPTEQMAMMDSNCPQQDKPHETGPCPTLTPCPTDLSWSVGLWEQGCGSDPCEMEQRWVECVLPVGDCNPLTQPPQERQCGNITCGTWSTGHWSQCSADCGEGVQFRQVSCEGGIACRLASEPRSVTECQGECHHGHALSIDNKPNQETDINESRDQSLVHDISDKVESDVDTTNVTNRNKGTDRGTSSNDIGSDSHSSGSQMKDGVHGLKNQSSENGALDGNNDDNGILLSSSSESNGRRDNKLGIDSKENSSNGGGIDDFSHKNTAIKSNDKSDEDAVVLEMGSSRQEKEDYNDIEHRKHRQTNIEENNITTHKIIHNTDSAGNSITEDNESDSRNENIVSESSKQNSNSTVNINASTTTPAPHSTTPEISFSDFNVIQTEEIDTGIVLEYDFMVPSIAGRDKEEDKISTSTTKIPPTESSRNVSNTTLPVHKVSSVNSSLNTSTENSVHKSNNVIVNNTETPLNSKDEEKTSDGVTSSSAGEGQNQHDADKDFLLTNVEEGPSLNSDYNYSQGREYEYDPLEDEEEYEYDDYNLINSSESTSLPPRPTGIAEDKLNVDDFEIVEVIRVPRKNRRRKGRGGGRKKNRKTKRKLVVHAGEDAISMLNSIINESKKRNHRKHSNGIQNINLNTLIPVYSWNVGHWNNCSSECNSGSQSRTIQCLEVTTGTIVDTTLCSQHQQQPPDLQHCNTVPCIEWSTTPWSNCSTECGAGHRTRLVTCPSSAACDEEARPLESESCELKPCVRWSTGPWSLCTKTCGNGYQIRSVRCVDNLTRESSDDCPRDLKPPHKRACNARKCSSSRRGQVQQCTDRLDPKLCKRLVHMCSTKFLRTRCCRTCRMRNRRGQ